MGASLVLNRDLPITPDLIVTRGALPAGRTPSHFIKYKERQDRALHTLRQTRGGAYSLVKPSVSSAVSDLSAALAAIRREPREETLEEATG